MLSMTFENSNDFNPRSRTGSDANRHEKNNGNAYFNPRSRTGSDESRP